MPRRGWAPPTSPTAGPTCRRPGPPSPRPWTGAWGWSWASGKRSLRPGETTRRTWCPWCWRTAASSPPARGWTATSGRRTRASPPRRTRSRGWSSVFWAARGLVRCSPCLLSAHTQLSLDTLAFYYESSIRRSLCHNFDFNCFQFQQKNLFAASIKYQVSKSYLNSPESLPQCSYLCILYYSITEFLNEPGWSYWFVHNHNAGMLATYCIVSLKMTGGMAGNISVEKTLESSSTVNTQLFRCWQEPFLIYYWQCNQWKFCAHCSLKNFINLKSKASCWQRREYHRSQYIFSDLILSPFSHYSSMGFLKVCSNCGMQKYTYPCRKHKQFLIQRT